jgi:hypothetical protein
MEVLTLNGKRYVKASKAAKDFGYATDYVGQLCRSGAVDAHLVGRTWYVNPDVLGAHRVEKKRNARAKAREYAKKSIEETRSLAVRQNTKSFRNIAIRYNLDQGDLIPEVKKVSIVSEEQIAPVPVDDDAGGYTILNKDKKIIMSGTIPVYDVEEETSLTDTTILKPRIVRTRVPEKANPRVVSTADDVSPASYASNTTLSETDSAPVSFSEKLALQEISLPSAGAVAEIATDITSTEANATSTLVWYESRVALYVAVILIVISPLSFFLESRFDYKDASVVESLQIDSSDIKSFLYK